MIAFIKRFHPVWVYGAALIICLAIGALGGYASAANVDSWYLTISKPSFNPPSWIFGPVWTILYVMMAIAWARVLTYPNVSDSIKSHANRLFIFQLILNGVWSFIFFSFHHISFAFVDLFALWVVLYFTLLSFMKISRLAGWLLLPYWLWVTFAGVLNGFIWYLN